MPPGAGLAPHCVSGATEMTGSVSRLYRTPGVSWPSAMGTISALAAGSSDGASTSCVELTEDAVVPHAVVKARRTNPKNLDRIIGDLDIYSGHSPLVP
jgi:hypothetical protein